MVLTLVLALLVLTIRFVTVSAGATAEDSIELRILGSNFSIYMTMEKNSTGHITSAVGYFPELIQLIAQRFHLRLVWMPIHNIKTIDDSPAGKGLISRMLDGDADLTVGGLLQTVERIKRIDMTVPVFYESVYVLIPYPEASVDNSALSKPFDSKVWIGLVICLSAVTLAWYFAGLVINRLLTVRRQGVSKEKHHSIRNGLYTPAAYSLTVLLSQGNLCPDKSLTIRLIATVWCLAASVLVPAYSSNLLSYIVSPQQKPLIDSIYDVPNVPDLKAAFNRGLGVDLFMKIMSGLNLNTTYAKIVSSLQKTAFRCDVSAVCLSKVSSGGYIYIDGQTALNHFMNEDLSRTGDCHFTMATKPFGDGRLVWGMPKNNHQLHTLMNVGILELDAYGLTKYLQQKVLAKPSKCLKIVRSVSTKQKLRLKQFFTTFALLGAGYALALLSFLIELILAKRRQRTIRDAV